MGTNSEKNKIDIILTWVDGNDPLWKKEKDYWQNNVKSSVKGNSGEVRYRDWDNLQYIFRGIEKFMPWVNCVHFVTWGHLPKWLNKKHPKLHIVNHRDFIPEEYLPTFNSNVIELNAHRIPGLAEQFINFNDDTFVIAPTVPEDFFYKGLPKDMAVLSPAPCFREVVCFTEMNNFIIINDHFGMEDIKKYRKKWYSIKYGKFLLRTILFSKFKSILGIFEPHIPSSHLKRTMCEVWEKEKEILDATSRHKFRTIEDVNDWLFRHWQIMSGNFEPRRWDFGILMGIAQREQEIIKLLENPGKTKMVCINDSEEVENFEKSKNTINKALNDLLPEKSAFEV